ncbi:LysR family transcriptional regulator [Xanthomonas hortorum]|uniref:HTH-type transcriptional regulator TrpI n=3 Tax=Xanthomonas hortorum TaxID=56454 RepID=A0A6V7CSQ6_9XANT|nr:LysR family transcriptional regulator [Xanthomonas hortorum]APP81247.1 transcriptional regulator [Xanthomonas hortorum pv. gardneri]KLA95686.1 transcriptional regulator [Xanthomonas hortorum pv. gardneri]KLB02015.1 transcriptional regulator [Xanthomonas hortorum pv. gardneri]KLB03596.1 transcriptional regulator [Xanthomonas hortorum pv. gardneri]KLB07558.1 transcriptional regulator [Xanthomonas hortorum pv. gardneri]
MSYPLPPLAALRAFESAARLQSVSRAAQELHVTHGAISRHVRTLEQSLETALFSRQGRGLVLTAAGTRLRDATGEGFALIGETWAGLLRRPGSETPLVLGCSGSLLARWVIPHLSRLQQDLPDVRLHLSASEQAPGPELDGLDAALLLDTPPWPGEWQVHELGVEWIGPVLSPQLASTTQLDGNDPAALLDHALLHTRSRPQAWPEWAQTHGVAPEALRFGTEFEHLVYLLEAAAAGLGVAIAPQPLVAADLAAGRLLAPWGFTPTRGRWVLCAAKRNPDPRIERLAGWLRGALTEDQVQTPAIDIAHG